MCDISELLNPAVQNKKLQNQCTQSRLYHSFIHLPLSPSPRPPISSLPNSQLFVDSLSYVAWSRVTMTHLSASLLGACEVVVTTKLNHFIKIFLLNLNEPECSEEGCSNNYDQLHTSRTFKEFGKSKGNSHENYIKEKLFAARKSKRHLTPSHKYHNTEFKKWQQMKTRIQSRFYRYCGKMFHFYNYLEQPRILNRQEYDDYLKYKNVLKKMANKKTYQKKIHNMNNFKLKHKTDEIFNETFKSFFQTEKSEFLRKCLSKVKQKKVYKDYDKDQNKVKNMNKKRNFKMRQEILKSDLIPFNIFPEKKASFNCKKSADRHRTKRNNDRENEHVKNAFVDESNDEDSIDDTCVTIATIVENHTTPQALIYCHQQLNHYQKPNQQQPSFQPHPSPHQQYSTTQQHTQNQPHHTTLLSARRLHIFTSLSSNFSIFFNPKAFHKKVFRKQISNSIYNDYHANTLLVFEGL